MKKYRVKLAGNYFERVLLVLFMMVCCLLPFTIPIAVLILLLNITIEEF